MKKAYRAIAIPVCLFHLYSCNNTENQAQPVADSLSGMTHAHTVNENRRHPEYPAACHFQEYVNSPSVPKLAKQIFNHESWDGNDAQALRFMDRLTDRDTAARAFYFRLVTDIPSNAQLDYREAFYMNATDYVTEHPASFIAFFDHKDCFNDRDMDTWVDMVAAEYGIQAENDIRSSLEKLFKDLRYKCRQCTDGQKANMERFIERVNKKI